MSVLDNFEQWKQFLGERLEQAQSNGMDNGVVSEMAYRLGDYLANEVEPKNEQERILSELWKIADQEEQHILANLMVKLVKG
ncbi:DUF3243 domain-containing protein [Bacillus sp. 165]|uniref:DUF3243 domain-containing protein n=1 Tax=Bacillus sp. 165 TaxID=1529117 RepID=UPI001ADBC5AA|nr:DUF3243 domain-containing protein [Bacillus sp. 165]MBO9128891.1 DUF3243 domain-containing protein [Bacillus sp. 165]